ncbi:hypothetical protein HYQ46_007023 [Verticillium longisporum]|nr:hypothetical protein HYQ46_007023 [Verticillium longisporum]
MIRLVVSFVAISQVCPSRGENGMTDLSRLQVAEPHSNCSLPFASAPTASPLDPPKRRRTAAERTGHTPSLSRGPGFYSDPSPNRSFHC